MALALGARAERLTGVRALLATKGRRERGRFVFEGPTLLHEARRSGCAIDELYATQAAYDATPAVRELEAAGVPVFIVDERGMAKISGVDTPSGIVAVAPIRVAPLEKIFERDGRALVLADLNDPGNAGTLLRTADAFGCRGAVFGHLGADPYHPKVVRAAMGAIFRLPVAVATAETTGRAAREAGFALTGLAGEGAPLAGASWPARAAVVVGHERHGLGPWRAVCDRVLAIGMPGEAESLNAAIAGSIGLYEACRQSG